MNNREREMLKLLKAIEQIDIKQNILDLEKKKALQDVHKYLEYLREYEV